MFWRFCHNLIQWNQWHPKIVKSCVLLWVESWLETTKDLEKLTLCRKNELDAHIRYNLRSASWYQQNWLISMHQQNKLDDHGYFSSMCQLMGKNAKLFSEDEMKNLIQ